MLIGLAAKNAILIVEFAKTEYEHGKSLTEAALTGARIRLRPILMTSFAFILGCVPLWMAAGSGGISRQTLGTVVIGGMLGATLFGIFVIPVTFYVVEKLTLVGHGPSAAGPGRAAAGRPSLPPAPDAHGPQSKYRSRLPSNTARSALPGRGSRPGLPWDCCCPAAPWARTTNVPPPTAPSAFRGEAPAAGTNSFADLPWWQVFHDETLQGLIRTALTNNYDLRIAVTRVEQARELAQLARTAFYPQLNYVGALGRQKNAPGGSAAYNNGNTASDFMAAGKVSWDVDLWGRLRRLSESARAQYLASEEARRDVTISVISDVAQAWFQLLALDEQLAIARDASNSFGGSLKHLQRPFARGRGLAVGNVFRRRPPGLRRRGRACPRTADRASGEPTQPAARTEPGADCPRPNRPDQPPPPDVPAGLPSVLLERRPDIREAEQLMRSANAQVGVSVANFYPNLSLTALFGQVSPQLSTFTSGGANAWGRWPTWPARSFRAGSSPASTGRPWPLGNNPGCNTNPPC